MSETAQRRPRSGCWDGYLPGVGGGLVDSDPNLEETGLSDADDVDVSEIQQQLVAQVRRHSI